MKKLQQFLMMAAVAVAAVSFTSCNGNDSYDGPNYYGYATLGTDVATNSYWFIDDDGKTYKPTAFNNAMSSGISATSYKILDEDGKDKNGNRVFVYFNLLNEPVTGYDYNTELFSIVDILSKKVEKATTEAELSAFGDDGMYINQASLNGDWIDVCFSVSTATAMNHKVSLVDNQTTKRPEGLTIPEGYTYLELRQLANGSTTGTNLGTGYVSYKLDDNYNPAKTGAKGLYIRVNRLNGSVEYLTLTYKAPKD